MHDIDSNSSDDAEFVPLTTPMGPTLFMPSTLEYQPLTGGRGDEGGTSCTQDDTSWIENMLTTEQYIGSSHIPSHPPSSAETEQTAPYVLRQNPRPREQFTFSSQHMPRQKRGRGR